RIAGTARLGGCPVGGALAVERLADDARERGLPAAARTAEQKRVVHATGRECVTERARDVFLSDDLGERRRPVLASEDQIGHARALYPLGTSLQRQRLADLLGLHQHLVAEIPQRRRRSILVQRAVTHEPLAAVGQK